MRVAFIADPLDSFKTYKDSTFAMMVEVNRRDHEIWFFEQAEIEREPSGLVRAHAARLQLTGRPKDWYALEPRVWMALREFDAIVMRKDPPFDMEYVYSTYLLELAEQQGARVFNRPRAIRDHNEKMAILGFEQFVAPTLVTRDNQRLRAFHAEHQDIIIKPLDGMGGTGVFRVREDELNLGAIIESVSVEGTRTVMAQRYIPEIVEGDKRILLIGGEPVPYCLARIPQGKEIRGNLAQGGVGRAQKLSARDLEIAATLAPVLLERGLLLVGIDVIGDYLTEVNVTSPTCFQEITEQTGYPVAKRFVDALETALH
ncbi:MAG: glutathione synthase [Burkholderiaceae bacterium]|jgi:glutathione synthase